MTKVGIVVAMAVECTSLTRQQLREGDCLPLDENSLLALSGAGPKAADRAASQLLGHGADVLISWGCAAALDSRLKPGDLFLPERIIGADSAVLTTAADWRNRLIQRLAGHVDVFEGALAESQGIVATPLEKHAIHAATTARALDMESAAVARLALRFDKPFLAVRSIADPSHVTVPPSVLAAFDANGKLDVPKMLARALFRPTDFIGIVRLGRHFGAAMKSLRKVATLTRPTGFDAAPSPSALRSPAAEPLA